MTNIQLIYFKNILLAKRKFIQDTIERLNEESQIRDDSQNDNSRYDTENMELNSFGKEEYFMIIQREVKYLNLIEDTLISIEKGKYGICKYCEKEIPFERLEAVPTANTCVNCKTLHSKRLS